jgi:hypothetical protein
MKEIIIFISIIIGLFSIPYFFKFDNPKIEKRISAFIVYSFLVFVFLTILLFNDLRLKGMYTYSIFGLLFIFSCILYFVLVKNTKRKLVKAVFLIPTLVVVSVIIYLGRTTYVTNLNDGFNLEVGSGGFMACGEHIRITKANYGIFTKTVQYINGICVIGINKIQVEEKKDNKFKISIFHNGEMDEVNPLNYDFELEK